MFRTDVQNLVPAGTRPPRALPRRCDVAVIGGGMSGMATALRLQADGLSTVVFEAHGHAGGCAGYYRHRGFSFDVGATTLVDFAPGGVGAELLDATGLTGLDGHDLPGYVAWLPDRTVTLHRDPARWHAERLRALGDTRAHRRFWAGLDHLAHVFWSASRAGIRLPVRTPADALHDLRAVGLRHWPLARHLNRTLGDELRRHGLRGQDSLVALLGMLVEDTVHSAVDRAPLINAALGVTIRGAGLSRHRGGMHGFWRRLVAHYRSLGGDLRTGCRVEQVTGRAGAFAVHTPRGTVTAATVVSAVPAQLTAALAPPEVAAGLGPYLRRDEPDLGGAVVVFLGVPEDEVAEHEFTHHQLLHDYARPLGEGNNMFVSVSGPGDLDSAPPGHRAVMISTHTELGDWAGLSEADYAVRKEEIGRRLIGYARRAYPRLGERAVVCQVGTPRSYQRFTGRPGGAVGGVRQTPANTNQHALGHRSALPGFWLVGDSTWPGLGTVACVLGSRIVADGVRRDTAAVAR
ncbi:C-3',4' desaturase CrtD [Catellatospora sp. TT07R-123]|uniref:phytoene desaturase family protein n=1 Tax=Catellatospora sp. TT07R-123 TaxID=2733863 RepID=UPI001B28290C|nr:NAD(P)/FAD-dependent oxidoreductase [Catellatospora sp. TT07R-123]GHJ46972.1 C-3',4' desaturase CrtD [Catellatospora sp. TT07R-123]